LSNSENYRQILDALEYRVELHEIGVKVIGEVISEIEQKLDSLERQVKEMKWQD
jgi:hypothetical protein